MDALQEQNIPSSNKTAETELESERNPEPFATQLNCFNFVGFNRKGSTMYPNIFRLLHVLPALLLAFSSYGFYNFIAANYEDVLAVADCLGPLSSNIIIFTKLTTFVVFEKKFYVLMDEIKALPGSDYLIFNRTLRVEKAATLTYLTSVCFTGFSLCVVPPLVDVASWWLHGTELRREMLYKASFPYATDVSPGYELTYLMETALTYFAIILLVILDLRPFKLSSPHVCNWLTSTISRERFFLRSPIARNRLNGQKSIVCLVGTKRSKDTAGNQ